MNKKSRIREAALLMAVSLLVMMSAGCALKPTAEIEQGIEEKNEVSEWKYDGGEFVIAKERNELVTAHADAGGVIKDVDVSVEIKGIQGGDDASGRKTVRDKTTLTDISNKNGDEEFEKKDSYVFFNNLGQDIKYEGKSKSELPVGLEVKYYLDGEEISHDKIKGQKGHVKVVYKFTNRESREVEAGGSVRSAYVPFAALTLVMLEGDSNTNIETRDCRLSSFNSEKVIMGFTMPGMKENMKYLPGDSQDDLPDKFSFEMDTEAFELGFSTTIITSNILDESIDLSELTEMRGSLSDLSDAGSKLADAGDKADKGAGEFGNYLRKYLEGAADVDSGISELNKGIQALNSGSKDIRKAGEGIRDGIKGLEAGYAEALSYLNAMLEADPENKQLQGLAAQYEALGEKFRELSEGSEKNTEGLEEFINGIDSAAEGSKKLASGSSALTSQGSKLLEGYSSLEDGVAQYTDAVCRFYDEGIKKLVNEGSSKINDIESFVRMIETADDLYSSYSGGDEDQKSRVTFIIETDSI